MNKIITMRDSDTVAAEINTIKETARQVMIASAIMIGGKLAEAKSMVPHGEWGKWLEEKVDYSQSTANNLMKLHQEYGQGQVNLFDNWTNSEAFANMSYTQHLAMMALPFENRLAFAEEHHVEEMSTRELDKAVREELDRLKKQLKDTEDRAEAAEATLADVEEDRNRAEQAARDNDQMAKDYLDAMRKAEKATAKANEDKVRAEKSEASALALVKSLNAKLAEAEAKAQSVAEELEQARNNPEISAAVMEEMRLQVEADAVKKATEKLEAQLAEARKQAEEATAARNAAEQAVADAARKLEQARTADKMADPDVASYKALSESLRAEYDRLNGYRLKVAERDPDAGERLKQFQKAMLAQWTAAIQE